MFILHNYSQICNFAPTTHGAIVNTISRTQKLAPFFIRIKLSAPTRDIIGSNQWRYRTLGRFNQSRYWRQEMGCMPGLLAQSIYFRSLNKFHFLSLILTLRLAYYVHYRCSRTNKAINHRLLSKYNYVLHPRKKRKKLIQTSNSYEFQNENAGRYIG